MAGQHNLDTTTVAEVCADLIAKISGDESTGSNPPPLIPPGEQPLQIGSNLQVAGTPLFSDLFYFNSHTWQHVNNGYKYTDAPVSAPPGSHYYLNIASPVDDGGYYIMKWREPGNNSSVSTWSRQFTNYYQDGVGTRMSEISESFENGVFSTRFRYFRDPDRPPEGLIHWRGSGTIDLVSLLPETVQAGDPFNPGHMTAANKLVGNVRALELAQANTWQQEWTWAQRARLDPVLHKSALQPSFAMEHWRNYCHRTNRNLEWIITHKLPKSTIQAMAVALMTGVGMDDGIPLRSDLQWYVELCDNEPWNPGLTGAYLALAREGAGRGYVGNNENGARLYTQAQRSQEVATWIEEAVPEHMHRIVRIVGLSPQNDLFDYETLIGYGLTKFEAVSKSCYYGYEAKQRYGGNTPAEIAVPWSIEAARNTDHFLRNRSRYIADGKRLLSYEIGTDLAYNDWTPEQREQWLLSDEFRAIYLRELRRIASGSGDHVNLYWDFGFYREGGAGCWGHYQGGGKPSPKWDVAVQVQAEVDAALQIK